MLTDKNLLVPETSDVGWEVSIDGEEFRLTETDSAYDQSRVDGVMDKCACLGTMLFDRMSQPLHRFSFTSDPLTDIQWAVVDSYPV